MTREIRDRRYRKWLLCFFATSHFFRVLSVMSVRSVQSINRGSITPYCTDTIGGTGIASVELGRWSVRNPRTFITENTENTECRGSPCRTPGNQDFHSDFLSRCSSCLARPPYSPFSPYSPFLFANRSFRPPNTSDVIPGTVEKNALFSELSLDKSGKPVIIITMIRFT